MVMLTIGAFSRLAAVSIKTLRYYDRAGVFRPAHVDPRSGYRYYKTDQLATLRELRLLRELGCSVANLRTWTADHRDADRRTALLLRLRGTIYHRLGDDFQRLVAIDRWIRQRVATPGESREDSIPTERRIPTVPHIHCAIELEWPMPRFTGCLKPLSERLLGNMRALHDRHFFCCTMTSIAARMPTWKSAYPSIRPH
jgi:DNA-binding transcriptional MerR regulator